MNKISGDYDEFGDGPPGPEPNLNGRNANLTPISVGINRCTSAAILEPVRASIDSSACQLTLAATTTLASPHLAASTPGIVVGPRATTKASAVAIIARSSVHNSEPASQSIATPLPVDGAATASTFVTAVDAWLAPREALSSSDDGAASRPPAPYDSLAATLAASVVGANAGNRLATFADASHQPIVHGAPAAVAAAAADFKPASPADSDINQNRHKYCAARTVPSHTRDRSGIRGCSAGGTGTHHFNKQRVSFSPISVLDVIQASGVAQVANLKQLSAATPMVQRELAAAEEAAARVVLVAETASFKPASPADSDINQNRHKYCAARTVPSHTRDRSGIRGCSAGGTGTHHFNKQRVSFSPISVLDVIQASGVVQTPSLKHPISSADTTHQAAVVPVAGQPELTFQLEYLCRSETEMESASYQERVVVVANVVLPSASGSFQQRLGLGVRGASRQLQVGAGVRARS